MSGFVAAVRNCADPELAMRLQDMSQRISHRGDNETVITMSDRCVVRTRDRMHCGYKVDTYHNNNLGIVLDGLLTNKKDLQLAVNADSSSNPAEIVLLGFEKFGASWLANIDGSFALMIIDLRSGETTLARDRFGHRPLYFLAVDNNVWVGSEIKALLGAPGYQSSINSNMLHSSIAYGITPGPQTLFSNIHKVVPGFEFNVPVQGNYRTNNFFEPTLDLKTGMSMHEAKETILTNLRASVEHYVQECPKVGTTLSGGVDSALLTHLAAENAQGRITAFGFGSDDWPADESRVAEDVAARIGVSFKRCSIATDGNLLQPLRNVVSSLEEPTRFENGLALEFMARHAAQDCTALMTGEGADFMLGSREHRIAKILSRILLIPGFLRTLLRRIPLQESSVPKLRTIAKYLSWDSVRDYDRSSMVNGCDLVAGCDGFPHIEITDMLPDVLSGWPVEAQFTYITLRESAHCWIERMEKISAAAGLESFHPFETNSIFQFGLEMPYHARHSRSESKPALRSLAADIMGDSFANREKQQLAAPMKIWLDQSAQLREAVLNLKQANSRIREYLDNSAVDKYLAAYERDGAKSESVAVPIFRMLSFEIWLEMFA
jgi:asparagine synthase (glutamine-hydrolysing)